MTEAGRRHIPLHTKILVALIVGAVLGVLVNVFQPPASQPTSFDWLITYVFGPVGQISLRLLFLTVVPLLSWL